MCPRTSSSCNLLQTAQRLGTGEFSQLSLEWLFEVCLSLLRVAAGRPVLLMRTADQVSKMSFFAQAGRAVGSERMRRAYDADAAATCCCGNCVMRAHLLIVESCYGAGCGSGGMTSVHLDE